MAYHRVTQSSNENHTSDGATRKDCKFYTA